MTYRSRCIDTRKCFGKRKERNGEYYCRILTPDSKCFDKRAYESDGDCPFCKKDNRFTNGTYYPHRDFYRREKTV